MKAAHVAAVDLGASGGKVLAGRIGRDTFAVYEAGRFANGPVRQGRSLRWDVRRLYRGTLDGLRLAQRELGHLDGVAIDGWAMDYGVVDATGSLMANPYCYRDERTAGVMERALNAVPREELYDRTGIQFLPFNTIYQLMAADEPSLASSPGTVLLIPDLLNYWMTGVCGAELTNASTTQLLDLRTHEWATDIADRLGIRVQSLPPLHAPGELLGPIKPSVLVDAGLEGPVSMFSVGSHDTASAVVALPALDEEFAYISCGTWSLVGVELTHPVVTKESLLQNFTNELGVDGTIRYLRNVMGLWLLQESINAWRAAGLDVELRSLLLAAMLEPSLAAVFDPDDPVFLAPGNMPDRIRRACALQGQPVPETPAAVVRSTLESLALAHRRAVRAASSLSGRDVRIIHLVGGGSRNELLCQLTADACGVPVLAGPMEATGIGNLLVQARALGAVQGGLAELRALVRHTQEIRRYEPRGGFCDWDEAEARIDWRH